MITRAAEQIEHEKQQAHALDAVAFERWLSGEVQNWHPIQEARAIVADRARDRMQWIQESAERYAKATAELRARMTQQRNAREISPAFIQRKQAQIAALQAARKARENLIMARLDKRSTFEGVPCVTCAGTRRYTAGRTHDCVACANERTKAKRANPEYREKWNAAARAKRDRRPLPFVRTPEQRAARSAAQRTQRAARRAAA